MEESNVELVNFSSLCLSKKYHVLAGATRLCQGHYIKMITYLLYNIFVMKIFPSLMVATVNAFQTLSVPP